MEEEKNITKIDEKKVKTPRQMRDEIQFWEIDENKKKNVLKFKDGELRKFLTVKGSELTIKFKDMNSKGLYPDDLLAFIRDMLISFNTKDKDTESAMFHIQKSIDYLDSRAVKKHGYEGSPEEQKYVPGYVLEEEKRFYLF